VYKIATVLLNNIEMEIVQMLFVIRKVMSPHIGDSQMKTKI